MLVLFAQPLKSKNSFWWKMLRPSMSHYTRACGPKRPRRFEWMQNLKGILHSMQYIMFQGLRILREVHLKEPGSKTEPRDYDTPKSHNP